MKNNTQINVIIIPAIVLAIINAFRINFNDLSWDVNKAPYTGFLIAVAILLVALFRLRK